MERKKCLEMTALEKLAGWTKVMFTGGKRGPLTFLQNFGWSCANSECFSVFHPYEKKLTCSVIYGSFVFGPRTRGPLNHRVFVELQRETGSVSQFWRIPESCYAFRYLYGPGGWFVISKFQRMLNRVRKTRLPLTFQLSMRRLAQNYRNGEKRENEIEGVSQQSHRGLGNP